MVAMSISLHPADLKNLRGNVELLRARTNALRMAETLDPASMKYGLQIASFLPEEFRTEDLFGGAAKYDTQVRGRAAVLRWEEGMKDDALSNIAGLRLAVSDTYARNHYFASMFGNFAGGLVVRGESGEEGEIVLRTEFAENGADIVFVWAPRGASMKIAEEVRGSASFAGRTFAVFAEEESRVEIVSLQKCSHNTIFFSNKFSHILRGGSVQWTDAQLGARFAKSDVSNALIEEDANALVSGISLAANQAHDMLHTASHFADNTHSTLHARGIAGSAGKIIYRGNINIGKKVSHARGMQEGKFLIAGADAEIDAIPALDIGSAASSSSHSLSISHLSEKDFYYSRLRGLAPYESQAMLFEGFLMQRIEDELVRDEIREKLSSTIYHV